ncbi:MAG: hypothetical protein ACPG80_01110 [Rickettsiales bacterium]
MRSIIRISLIIGLLAPVFPAQAATVKERVKQCAEGDNSNLDKAALQALAATKKQIADNVTSLLQGDREKAITYAKEAKKLLDKQRQELCKDAIR